MTEHIVQLPNLDKSSLLRELNHRINNELTIAIYAVSAKAVRSDSVAVKAALLDVVDLWVAKYKSGGDRSSETDRGNVAATRDGQARLEQLRIRRRVARGSSRRANDGLDASCNTFCNRAACAPSPRRSKKIPDQSTPAGLFR